MSEEELIQAVRARGLQNAATLALDVLEPFGAIGAQVLWVAQPAARLIGGWGDALGTLAAALEDPDGIERLRHALEDSDDIDEDDA